MYNFKFIIIKALAFQNEAAAALLAATATPKNLHVTEEDEEQETEMTNGENGENLSKNGSKKCLKLWKLV